MSVTCVAPRSALQRPLVGVGIRRGAGLSAGLFEEIDVDNFAGGGGVGMGFELATGKAFDIAINHDEAAIAMHRANHPHTRHLCESVWAVNPLELEAGRPVRLAWFSPDCKHFSRVKGAKPVEKKIRGLAWVAVRWAKRVKPRLIMLENVREFQDWGPLTPENRPCPLRKSQTFKRFVSTLRNLGYEVEWKILNAADYGAPTHRRRLFLIARSDGRPIVWPEKTHGSDVRQRQERSQRGIATTTVGDCGQDPEVGSGNHKASARRSGLHESSGTGAGCSRCTVLHLERTILKPCRPAASCIDWSILCPSIFDRKRPLAEKTLRRIALSIIRYVLNNPRPFIVNIERSYKDFAGQAVDVPLGTITAYPKGGKHALVTPTLMPVNHGGQVDRSRPADEPMNTLTASRCEYLVSPTLVQTGYSERDGQTPRALDIEKPLGTVVATGKHALVSAMIAKHYGGVVGHEPTRPLGTVTAVDHHSVVAAMLTKFRGDSKGSAADTPCPTITSGCGAKRPAGAAHALGVVSATLVGVGGRAGQSPPCPVDEPNRTTTAKADRAVVAATLTQFRGSNNGNGGDVEAPAPAQTAQNRPGLVAAFLTKWYGNDQHGQAVDSPAHTLTARDRLGLVTVTLEDGQQGVVVNVPASRGVEGGQYIITDIGLRMLTPRELARCQGFPDSYVLTGTQSNQVARIGNSVPPQVVEALIRANLPEACGRKAVRA